MSTFIKKAVNPKTGKIEEAIFIDDFYGVHQYAVGFAFPGVEMSFDVNPKHLEIYPIEEIRVPRVCIDFDGVIHSYRSGWEGDVPKDPPVRGIETLLAGLVDEGYEVVVLTTRRIKPTTDWLLNYGLDKYIIQVTNEKIPAHVYIDDRGLK